MVKLPYKYTDSDIEESSSRHSTTSKNVIKKMRFSLKSNYSILKYTEGNAKKKKCKAHSKLETDDMANSNSNRSKVQNKLPSILKHREKEIKDSVDEEKEEESESISEPVQSQYLPAGMKPGRDEGVALIVKKNVNFSRNPVSGRF